MRVRPWHVIVCVIALSAVLVAAAYIVGEPAKELLLGLGLNLLSSIVFFILLDLYWAQIKRANGKEVHGLDYPKFARNVARSKQVRILATFIYPFTDHPAHRDEKQQLLEALTNLIRGPSFAGLQLLFLHPASLAAKSRAAERKDDDVLRRIEETLATVRELVTQFDGDPVQQRIEVRLFSRMPAFALFQTDDFGSISFYYRDRPISEVTRYELYMDTPLGAFIERTFDDLWRDELTVPLEDYPQLSAAPSPVARQGAPAVV
jgi:hypothetical protein